LSEPIKNGTNITTKTAQGLNFNQMIRKEMQLAIPGNLLTTAMAVMPHTDVERALEVALSLDVPFWPQLPNYSYYEDMYVQAAEHFPGILLDVENRTLRFSRRTAIL
jgi:hypothetical protein